MSLKEHFEVARLEPLAWFWVHRGVGGAVMLGYEGVLKHFSQGHSFLWRFFQQPLNHFLSFRAYLLGVSDRRLVALQYLLHLGLLVCVFEGNLAAKQLVGEHSN